MLRGGRPGLRASGRQAGLTSRCLIENKTRERGHDPECFVDPRLVWKLYVGDDAGWSVPAAGSQAATGSGKLTVASVDRRVQEDARSVTWSGAGPAQVYLQTEEPIDLSRTLLCTVGVLSGCHLRCPFKVPI